MDDRTTSICASLDGRKFEKTAASDYVPPMHFACRSRLVEILFDRSPAKWDDFDSIIDGLDEKYRPKPGFGVIDWANMPPPGKLLDLYSPLSRSADIKLRRAYDDIIERGAKRFGEAWRAGIPTAPELPDVE